MTRIETYLTVSGLLFTGVVIAMMFGGCDGTDNGFTRTALGNCSWCHWNDAQRGSNGRGDSRAVCRNWPWVGRRRVDLLLVCGVLLMPFAGRVTADESSRLREALREAVEALNEVEEFLEERADAELFTDSPTPKPNDEMRLLTSITPTLDRIRRLTNE